MNKKIKLQIKIKLNDIGIEKHGQLNREFIESKWHDVIEIIYSSSILSNVVIKDINGGNRIVLFREIEKCKFR